MNYNIQLNSLNPFTYLIQTPCAQTEEYEIKIIL